MSIALPLRGERGRKKAQGPRTRPEIRPGSSAEALSVSSSFFAMLALVSIWALVQMLFLGGLSQERSQNLLYSKLRSNLAAETALTGGYIKPGTPIGLMSIPALGLQQVVVEGSSSKDTEAGPGHLPTTVLPGQAGSSMVVGRASTYGAPFGHITELRAGDPITVVNQEGKTTYHVLDVRGPGDPIPHAIAPTGYQSTLILATSQGTGALAALKASHMVYVDAIAPKAPPASANRPFIVPKSEQPMGRDLGALPLLVLLMTVMLGVAILISAAARRFPVALVWVIGTPVVIALAWCVSDVAVRLLPNAM